ncbi:MAG: DUF4442 domain-containing protein [Myxococcales bacterium]|nr:DUF4442 domain-containing protein [Myxococcales bacterium]
MSTNLIKKSYDLLKHVPGGKRLFSKMVGRAAPYTGNIKGEVLDIRPGYARVRLADRRAVRNHLNSIHAIALVNLGELATGLAFIYGLPDNSRCILTGISAEYIKKARGTLIAEGTAPIPETSERAEYTVQAEIRDARGEVVTRVTARWLIAPESPR